MKSIHVYEYIDKKNNIFDILLMICSAYLWDKNTKSKLDLYTDSITKKILEDLDVLDLWNHINTSVLDSEKNTGINKTNFWASSKLVVMNTINHPFTLIDTDFLAYSDINNLIPQLDYDVFYSHNEDGIGEYLKNDSDTVKLLDDYPLFEIWDKKALNVSFLSFKNIELKNKYINLSLKLIKEFSSKIPDNNSSLMTFCEQKILEQILLNNDYKFKFLIKNEYKCETHEWDLNNIDSNGIFTIDESSNKFYHYGVSKGIIKNNEELLCREILKFKRILIPYITLKNNSKLESILNSLSRKYISEIIYTNNHTNNILLEIDKKNVIKNNTFYEKESININNDFISAIIIPINDIELYKFEKYEITKQYYYSTKNINNGDIIKNSALNEVFNVNKFYNVNHLHKNYFNIIGIDGEKYVVLIDSDFVIDVIYSNFNLECRIYLEKIKDVNIKIYSEDVFNNIILKRYSNDIKKRHYHIAADYEIINDLANYFIFDGLRFDKNLLLNIKECKDTLLKILNGIDYYFCGTSIDDYAKDVDIYVKDTKNYNNIIDLLKRDHNFEILELNKMNSVFKYKGIISVDVVVECVSYDNIKNNAFDIKAQYLDLAHIFTSAYINNTTVFYKNYRLNKVFKSYVRNKFVNGTVNLDDIFLKKFEEYYKIINDNNFEDIYDYQNSDNSIVKLILRKDNGKYYLIVKSKYTNQLIKIYLDFEIKNIKFIDSENVSETCLFKNIIKNGIESTLISINIKNKSYSLIEFDRCI